MINDQLKHKMVFTRKQRVFIAEYYAKHNSLETCVEQFAHKFKTIGVFEKLSVKSSTQHVVRKGRELGPVADKIRNNPRKVGTPKNTARLQGSLQQNSTNFQHHVSL